MERHYKTLCIPLFTKNNKNRYFLYWKVTRLNTKNLLLNYYFRFMIKKFIKKLMERRKRNIKFRKEFYKKTGVDLNEINDNVGGGQ